MNVQEVFFDVATRLLGGMMFHEQMMNTYMFLSLDGYSMCHKYHYISESNKYLSLKNVNLKYHNRLIRVGNVIPPELIPESWYDSVRSDVPASMRFEALTRALEEWIKWEKESYVVYSSAYQNLLSMGEVASAEVVKEYALDTKEEVVYAEDELLRVSSTGYDMAFIQEEQKALKKEFTKKIRKAFDEVTG